MPASFFPVPWSPNFSSAFLDPVALDPDILSSGPPPVSGDPDVIRTGLNNSDFLPERGRGKRRPSGDDTTGQHNKDKTQKGYPRYFFHLFSFCIREDSVFQLGFSMKSSHKEDIEAQYSSKM
jgi:hypothetical protein